jgi:hypothetical protein
MFSIAWSETEWIVLSKKHVLIYEALQIFPLVIETEISRKWNESEICENWMKWNESEMKVKWNECEKNFNFYWKWNESEIKI